MTGPWPGRGGCNPGDNMIGIWRMIRSVSFVVAFAFGFFIPWLASFGLAVLGQVTLDILQRG